MQLQRFYRKPGERRFSKISPLPEVIDEVDDLQAEDLDEPHSSHMMQKYDTSKFGKRMIEHTETTSQKKEVKLETPRSKNYDTVTRKD